MSVSSATDRPTDLVVRARYDRGAVAKNNSTTDSFVAARPLKLYCCTDVVALAATNAAPRPPRQTSKATKEEYKRNIRSIVSFFFLSPFMHVWAFKWSLDLTCRRAARYRHRLGPLVGRPAKATKVLFV